MAMDTGGRMEMKRCFVLLLLALLVTPLAAVPEPSADEVQANRRRLQQLARNPGQIAKLREEAAAFYALPEDRRRQPLELHEKLHQESGATQARLHQVLERYAEWVSELDEATRQKVTATRDKQKRLDLIREVRETQWLQEQPKVLRDRIANTQGDARRALIAKEKEEDRQRRLQWLIASRFWMELEGDAKLRRQLPTKFTELHPQVQNYVANYLSLFLSPEESDQLKKAEGHPWPRYPLTLVEVASKHPAALPGPRGPKSLSELPREVLFRLKLAKKKDMRLGDGKWPEFGIALVKFAKQRGAVPFDHEFLAYKKDCLTNPMRDFMAKKLEPLLSDKEFYRLNEARDHWPEYPETIQDLANRHGLHVPWLILPRTEDWDRYRVTRLER